MVAAINHGEGISTSPCSSARPCNGSTSQIWTPGPNYSLVRQASGLCLTEPNSNPVNGEPVQIATCTGGNNQTWRLPARLGGFG
jgi:hypothetical protein